MASDRVILECPTCDSFVPVHTYKGKNTGITYSVDEAPLILLAEINQESRAGRIQCMTCGDIIALVIKFVAIEKSLDVQQKYNKGWRVDE